jgi:crotonobetainyl-CoA:carnitine CoA-transferase CaiB-like acyl-CoA transferase
MSRKRELRRALRQLKVDLSQGIAGPYCAMLLAQHGAEVIKVEGIGEGDWARTLGTRYGSHSAYSIIGNLGKKSIAVDLKSAAGKQVVWRLLKGADIFLEGFRPGVIRRLGFDYEAVAAREPRLLYLSISGFGQTGPLSERPAMDPVLQAYTGLMNENRGEDGIPHRVPVIVVDMSTALAFRLCQRQSMPTTDEPRGRTSMSALMQSATALRSIRLLACCHLQAAMKPAARRAACSKIADGWMSLVVAPTATGRHCAWSCGAGRRSLLRRQLYVWPIASPLRHGAVGVAGQPGPCGAIADAGRLMHERLNSYAEFLDQPQVLKPA